MAAFALGLTGDAAAVEPLRQALADPSPLVAGRAAEGLGLIGDAASAAAIGQLVAAQVAAAAGIAPDDSRQALDPGVEAFRLGVYALARLKAYEPLAAAVLDANGQPRVLWWPVAYALQWTEDRRALPALLTLAKTEAATTRAFAAKGLGAIKDPAAVSVLLPLSIRAIQQRPGIEAIRALGRIGDARASQPLWAVVRAQGTARRIRAEALLALEAAPDPGIQLLVDFLLSIWRPSFVPPRWRRLRKGTTTRSWRCCRGSIPTPTGAFARSSPRFSPRRTPNGSSRE